MNSPNKNMHELKSIKFESESEIKPSMKDRTAPVEESKMKVPCVVHDKAHAATKVDAFTCLLRTRIQNPRSDLKIKHSWYGQQANPANQVSKQYQYTVNQLAN